VKCLTAQDAEFDIGIVGVPFDTAVSYRPGEFWFVSVPVLFLNVAWSLESESRDLGDGFYNDATTDKGIPSMRIKGQNPLYQLSVTSHGCVFESGFEVDLKGTWSLK
jgi:hypothetical protein